MSLKSAVAAGVRTALKTVKDFQVKVNWTFTSSDIGSYDPLTDSFTPSDVLLEDMPVLIYDDKDDDTQMMFSSRGNFVESPTQMDTLKALIGADDTKGNIPSVKDNFVWQDVKFTVDAMERVPGDSVYIAKCSRV